MPDHSINLEGYRAFEFDLAPALLDQLVKMLDLMECGGLAPEITGKIPNAQGVYQLFHKNKLVYIGKTDSEAGLRQRLSRHAWTVRSRQGLGVDEMSFKAVEVLVFSAMDLETALIKEYRARGENPAWNGSGFGSNDPGRNRDKTALRADGFDANYPINIDVVIDFVFEGEASIYRILQAVAPTLPYTLRFEKSKQAKQDLDGVLTRLPPAPLTVRQLITSIVSVLPSGWQATRLPGRVIMYREKDVEYPGGELIARS